MFLVICVFNPSSPRSEQQTQRESRIEVQGRLCAELKEILHLFEHFVWASTDLKFVNFQVYFETLLTFDWMLFQVENGKRNEMSFEGVQVRLALIIENKIKVKIQLNLIDDT